jgi:signal transduction histidine kinase
MQVLWRHPYFMKQKVYFALFLLIVCFLAGGFYILKTIDGVTDNLETIITLNKVEFLRETLLNKIVVVQADLLLKDTPHARQVDTFISHVDEMHEASHNCLSCHHSEEVKSRIIQFQQMINQYMKKLSRIYTLRANEARLKNEKQSAFDLGQVTLDVVSKIVISSQHKTSRRIQQARQDIKHSELFLYTLMLLGPLLIIFTAFYFFRNFTRSVLTLTNATRKIKDGDMDYRIKNQLKDEFRELAKSFNDMAISLKEQQHKIQQAERLAAVGELAAGLAHEVKNPLAGIKVSIEVLKSELNLEQEDKEIFLRIINEINRIESLLKNMLNYARPSKPQPEFFNINGILDSIIKISEYSLKSPSDPSRLTKDINFVKDFAEDIPEIYADPGQLQQVFLNLLLNGIDAIDEKGTITIKSTRTADECLQIQISDTGKGIAPETLDNVFNPFFTTKSKGNGLGLAICKRLIAQHKGNIEVFNNPESGATFVITLPVKLKIEESTS